MVTELCYDVVMPELNDYITTDEAAQILGVNSTQWVRDLVRTGRIAGVKAGRTWLVLRADVENFERKKRGPKPQRNT